MTCDHCRRAARRNHPDIHFIEPEGAHGYLVDQIREVVADAHLAPIQATRKIYIIDRVDLLGTQAANAFLKTLEEPPENVVFILLGRTKDAAASHHRFALSGGAVPSYSHHRGIGHHLAEHRGERGTGAHRGRGVQWLGHESDRILQEPRKDRAFAVVSSRSSRYCRSRTSAMCSNTLLSS